MDDKKPETKRVDWRGANLRGTSLARLNLEHADMRAADLRNVNFSGSNLNYADFRGSNVEGANFQNASLYGAKMQGVEAAQADFRGADMRLIRLDGAYLDGALMPHPSPGDIADGPVRQDKAWEEREIERTQKPDEDANTEDAQNEPARGRSLPNEQRNPPGKGRGR